ncbi:hypothetical protein ABFS82_08G103100 [Erythranthe guttata]
MFFFPVKTPTTTPKPTAVVGFPESPSFRPPTSSPPPPSADDPPPAKDHPQSVLPLSGTRDLGEKLAMVSRRTRDKWLQWLKRGSNLQQRLPFLELKVPK